MKNTLLFPQLIKTPLKCNMLASKAFPQRFDGDLQAFMAIALFCQLNMTSVVSVSRSQFWPWQWPELLSVDQNWLLPSQIWPIGHFA